MIPPSEKPSSVPSRAYGSGSVSRSLFFLVKRDRERFFLCCFSPEPLLEPEVPVDAGVLDFDEDGVIANDDVDEVEVCKRLAFAGEGVDE